MGKRWFCIGNEIIVQNFSKVFMCKQKLISMVNIDFRYFYKICCLYLHSSWKAIIAIVKMDIAVADRTS